MSAERQSYGDEVEGNYLVTGMGVSINGLLINVNCNIDIVLKYPNSKIII